MRKCQGDLFRRGGIIVYKFENVGNWCVLQFFLRHSECSNDVGNDIDVSNIELAKHMWDERVYDIEIATATNPEICTSLVLSNRETLLLIIHDVRVRRQVEKSKKWNKVDFVTCEHLTFEVATRCITKLISFQDVTVKCSSRHFRSTLAKYPSPALDTSSEFFHILFALSQVFIKLIKRAKVNDEDQDETGSIENPSRRADLWNVLSLPMLFPCQSRIAHVL